LLGGSLEPLSYLLEPTVVQVSDKTFVDRETHRLVSSTGTLRVIRLTTGADERGFLFADDYSALVCSPVLVMGRSLLVELSHPTPACPFLCPQVDAAVQAEQDGDAAHALRSFGARILPACRGATVALSTLQRHLMADSVPAPPFDVQLRALMTHGFLVRGAVTDARAHPEQLLFTAPGMGALQRNLAHGRAAIMQFLRRRPQGRAPRSLVETRNKLRGCILPVRLAFNKGHSRVGLLTRSASFQAAFVVRDLLGSGSLTLLAVPVGEMLCLRR
jgi:hypothetical protein